MYELLIVALAIFLGFYMQTIAGFSGSLFALPILVLVMPLPQAIGLQAVLLFIFSGILVYQNRKQIDRKVVLEMTGFTIIGVVIGASVVTFANPEILKKVLGVFILVYVGYSLVSKSKVFARFGKPFALIGGFFSGAFASGGSLYVVHLADRIKDHKKMRATLLGLLGINNFLRLPLLAWYGVVNFQLAYTALLMLPIFILALFLGNLSYKRMNAGVFRAIVMILLTVGAISLLIDIH